MKLSAISVKENEDSNDWEELPSHVDYPSNFDTFLVLTSQFNPPVIKRHILMVVAVITMQVTRGKRDGGGNAVAFSGGNSLSCNGIVSAGLWLYYSYIFNLTTAAIFSMQHSTSVCVRISRLHVDQ